MTCSRGVLTLATTLLQVVVIFKCLTIVSGAETPLMVVVSGSMEPALQRGDLIGVWNTSAPLEVGEIVVFKVKERDTPIVHRIIHLSTDGQKVLTKGDANPVDDRGLYSPGQQWLTRSDIVGRTQRIAPYIGHVSLLSKDYPLAAAIVLALVCLWEFASAS